MKRLVMFILVFLVVAYPIGAQDDPENVEVVEQFVIDTPQGYVTTYSRTLWSPDSSLLIISFTLADDSYSSDYVLQQVYDVETGQLLFAFSGFPIWYADSSHILVWEHTEARATILDARTGAIAAGLADAGETFDRHPIQKDIINLDDSNTLRIYDSDTASLLLQLENVEDLPFYTADRSRFVVSIIDQGIEVYNTETYTLDYSLDGFRVELIGAAADYYGKSVWSPDGTMLSVVTIDSPREWLGPRHIWTLGGGLTAPIYNLTDDVVWSPDGTQIAGASDLSKVRIYDSTTGDFLETIREIPETPIMVEWWTENGILIKSGTYRIGPIDLLLWNSQTHEFGLQVGIGLETHYVRGNTLVSIELGYSVRLFDIETGELMSENMIRGPNWNSPDHRWMTAIVWTTAENEDDPTHVYVSHLESTELIADIETDTKVLQYIEWSPDSRYFGVVGEPTSVIWKVVEVAN